MPNRIKDQDTSDLCIYYQHTQKGNNVCPSKKRSLLSLENAEKVLAWIEHLSLELYGSISLRQLATYINLDEFELMYFLLELKAAKRLRVDTDVFISTL